MSNKSINGGNGTIIDDSYANVTCHQSTIRGDHNTILGNYNTIFGDHNIIFGDYTEIHGDDNEAIGFNILVIDGKSNNIVEPKKIYNSIESQGYASEYAYNNNNNKGCGGMCCTKSSCPGCRLQKYDDELGNANDDENNNNTIIPKKKIFSNFNLNLNSNDDTLQQKKKPSTRGRELLNNLPPDKFEDAPIETGGKVCGVCKRTQACAVINNCGHVCLCWGCALLKRLFFEQWLNRKTGIVPPACPVCTGEIVSITFLYV